MSDSLYTLQIVPAAKGKPRQQYTTTSTKFTERYGTTAHLSKWYFLTNNKNRVYLRYGRNTFGSSESNHIQFHDRDMRSYELNIFIGPYDWMFPDLDPFYGNVILDGVHLDMKPECVVHKSSVAIYIRRKHKLVIMRFYKVGGGPPRRRDMRS